MDLRCSQGGWCLWIQYRSPRALTFIMRPPSPISSIHLGNPAFYSHGVRSKVSCGEKKQTLQDVCALCVLLNACNKEACLFLIIIHYCHYHQILGVMYIDQSQELNNVTKEVNKMHELGTLHCLLNC